MKQCPCINCITFPICKAQVDEYTIIYKYTVLSYSWLYSMYSQILTPKCSIIQTWIIDNQDNRRKCFNDIYTLFAIDKFKNKYIFDQFKKDKQ